MLSSWVIRRLAPGRTRLVLTRDQVLDLPHHSPPMYPGCARQNILAERVCNVLVPKNRTRPARQSSFIQTDLRTVENTSCPPPLTSLAVPKYATLKRRLTRAINPSPYLHCSIRTNLTLRQSSPTKSSRTPISGRTRTICSGFLNALGSDLAMYASAATIRASPLIGGFAGRRPQA